MWRIPFLLYKLHASRPNIEGRYEELDQLHYKVENQLLKLIESLQRKQKGGQWIDSFQQV
jgi:hypothetical protein